MHSTVTGPAQPQNAQVWYGKVGSPYFFALIRMNNHYQISEQKTIDLLSTADLRPPRWCNNTCVTVH